MSSHEAEDVLQHESLLLTSSMIPTSPVFDAKESRFFERFDSLPSPEEVRQLAKAQHLEGLCLVPNRNPFSMTGRNVRPPPVVFKDLGLLVKWETGIDISEGQCQWAIGQLLKDRVPFPEIYGWRKDGDEVFLYMEYVHSQTLEQAWEVMQPDERVSVCSELRTAIDNLRQLEQHPEDRFIGNIIRSSFYDRAIHIESMSEAGPFNSVQEFHDWFTFLHRKPMPDPYSVPIEPFRHELPHDCPIKFTHGDLHRSNILIQQARPYRVLAIIDWEQSGWLPEYWEVRKAQWTVGRNEDWSKEYLPMILYQFMSTWDSWDYYTIAMGC